MRYYSLQDCFMQGVSAQDDIFLLNKFSKYGKEKERIVINYDHDSRLVEKLKSTYNDFPQNEASEFRTLVNIRKWVNKYLYFQNVSFLEEFREKPLRNHGLKLAGRCATIGMRTERSPS